MSEVNKQEERVKVKLSDGKSMAYSSLNDKSIPLEWHQLWHEVEVWYGDIGRSETAETLVKRLQEIVTSQSSIDTGVEGKSIEEAADEYVKAQGSHDKPHITKHDFIAGAKWASSGEAVEFGNWLKENGWQSINITMHDTKETKTIWSSKWGKGTAQTEQLYQLFKQKP